MPEWDDSSAYAKAIAQTDKLIGQGVSFSGKEANCLFINKGDGTFATASAITGWDFPDDSRAIGLTDWDGDGDLDAWISNRTAPMLRFLRNESPKENASIQLLLQGRMQREAAGSRATVKIRGQSPLIRTVKLGEGFQGQNSRWLHFGLGKDAVLESVNVTWPGGEMESFTGCAVGGRFILKQGTTKATAAPAARPMRAPKSVKRASPEESPATLLTASQICPPFPANSYTGQPVTFSDAEGPTLIHLWDVTCADCLPELKSLAGANAQIAAAGLRVVLLSAGADAETTAFLKDNAIPFPAASATDETVRRLRQLHELLFGSDLPLPNPSGLLLDGKGHAAAIYRGPVTVERLLADVRGLSTRWPERAALTLPFPGQWMDPPVPANPLTIPGELAEKGFLDDSLTVFLRHEKQCAAQPGCAEVLMALSAAFEKKGRFADAITTYRLTIRVAPAFSPALNNLAWHLAVCPDPSQRRPAEALPLIQNAVALTKRQNPDLLDTLATVHAANNQWSQAETTLLEAISIARSAGANAAVQQLEASLQRIRQRK